MADAENNNPNTTDLEDEDEEEANPNEGSGQKEVEGVEKVYYVEAIMGKRICNGIVQFKIRWAGYAEEDDTWEYIDNCHCPELIAKFEKENGDLVLEQFETEEMTAQRNGRKGGKKKGTGRASAGSGERKRPSQRQGRGRKRKLAENESLPSMAENGATESDNANTDNGENSDWIPFEEKDHYRIEDEGILVTQIIGMRKMEATDKLMALINYDGDFPPEYVPVEELRKNPSGKDLLIDFFLQRIKLI